MKIPPAPWGGRLIIHHDCLCDTFTLAKFQAGEELLEEDLSGTFESWDMPESFAVLDGMQ